MIRYGTSIAGTAGFTFVFSLGMALNRDLGRITLSASIAALAFGLLAYWWMTLWLVGLRTARKEQARQQQIEQKQEVAQGTTITDDAELAHDNSVP
jgi:hypothetical protein|tara:strand:- start:1848 stop:2135 length:288 start_codon:yes stop_codon:yes gene_type:complete